MKKKKGTTSLMSGQLAIKAIPTTWNGTNYRSRLEARWAIFFHHAGIRAMYEYKSYKLSSGLYLPDFWLPQVNMFGEVKPVQFNKTELSKAAELALITGHGVLKLIGTPDFITYSAIEEHYEKPGTVDEMDYMLDDSYLYEDRFYCNPGWSDTYDECTDTARNAVNAARTYRFVP